MPELLRISTLGGLDIHLSGRPLTGLASRKAEALLVYLACTQRQHARESLAAMLWDESSQSRALANLSVVLSSLRKFVGSYLEIRRHSVAFNTDSDYWLDIVELQAQLNRWRMQRSVTKPLSPQAAGDLSTALSLYKGEFLAGFHLRGSRDFEEWVLSQAQHILRQVIESLDELTAFYLDNAMYKKGIQSASRLLELDPLHEVIHRQMMQLLVASGQRGSALMQYETCSRALMDGLGVAPSNETQNLYEHIISGEKLPGLPPRPPAHNLPAQLTSLVGRREELEQIAVRLQDPACRLLTLVGAGGIGKTRLGLEAAVHAAQHYPDGVWLVELASLTEPEVLPGQIAAALGVSAQEASHGRAETDVLVDYLRDKSLLLVLDNCEHLVDACAGFAEELLKDCPLVKVLATSRERLAVPGESTFPVPPLELPPDQTTLQDLEEYPAVRLFLDRAAAARPGFALTEQNSVVLTEIIRRLDGIPLAIELAAARVKVLSLEQIAERLKDRLQLLTGGPRTALPRHKTLRATIDWSYSLLAERERALLRRLSVFSGGWTLESAEEVSNFRQGNREHILDGITQLVDKSLVSAEEQDGLVRYWMLETMRQYGVSELKEQGEIEEAHRRHAAFFVNLAERADNGLRDAGQIGSLNLLDSEHDNLRAALGWSIDNGEADLAFHLVAAMGWYWFMRGHWGEASRWLTKVLELDSDASQIWRAKAIYRAGGLELIRGNLVGTIDLVEETSQNCRTQGDEEGLAWCLNLLGQARMWQHEKIDEAYSSLSESAEIFDSMENEWGVAWSLRYLGQITEFQGNYKQGAKIQRKALRGFEQMGDTWNAAHSLYLLGSAAYRNGDFQEAKLANEACQEKCRLVEDKVMAAHSLRGLAQLLLHEGKIEQAGVLFEEALEALKKIGDESCAAGATGNLADVAQRKGEFEQAALLLRQSLVSFEKLGNEDAVAETVERFALLAAATGDEERAARLLGAAETQLGGTETLSTAFKVDRQKLVASLQNSFGDQSFKQFYAEGAAMSLQEAVAYATEELGGK